MIRASFIASSVFQASVESGRLPRMQRGTSAVNGLSSNRHKTGLAIEIRKQKMNKTTTHQVKMDKKMRYMLELLSRKWHVTISEAIRICLKSILT